MKMSNEYCPIDCEHLSLKESEQVSLTKKLGFIPPHVCNKYEQKLYHFLAHPKLYKCEECLKENSSDR
jgi:hypothetical protein